MQLTGDSPSRQVEWPDQRSAGTLRALHLAAVLLLDRGRDIVDVLPAGTGGADEPLLSPALVEGKRVCHAMSK